MHCSDVIGPCATIRVGRWRHAQVLHLRVLLREGFGAGQKPLRVVLLCSGNLRLVFEAALGALGRKSQAQRKVPHVSSVRGPHSDRDMATVHWRGPVPGKF
jgi:hypothetical protein